MASQSNMLLLAVIFCLTTTSAVLAQDLGVGVGLNITDVLQARVQGRLFCTPTGNPVIGVPSPIAGVTVNLIALNGQIIGVGVTNSAGFYDITANTQTGTLGGLIGATVRVRLPVNATCAALPTTGTLQAPLILIGAVNRVLLLVQGILALVV